MGAALPFAIAAQEADINAITVRLDSLYNAVITAPGAETCKVRYTGSDGKAPGGFLWQRGLGKGWTQGLRISLPDVSQNKAAEFDNFFQEIGRDNFVIRYNDHCSATLIEPLNTIYVYDYDSADSRLSFMKATTTGEICVPKVWTHCDSPRCYHTRPARIRFPTGSGATGSFEAVVGRQTQFRIHEARET